MLDEALFTRLPELDALTAALQEREARLSGKNARERLSGAREKELHDLGRAAAETRGTAVLEAWCKRERARTVLACLHVAAGNLSSPYPSEMDGTLVALMRESCMDARQVVNWCSNFRKRKWDAELKPAGLTRIIGTRRSTVQPCAPSAKRVRK